MSQQLPPLEIAYCDIIGATELPEEPMRLRPVARTRTRPYRYGLLYDDAGQDVLVPEDESFIHEEIDAGRFFQLTRPIPMKPRHWLLALEPGSQPQYIAEIDAPERMRKAALAALERCAQALEAGNLTEAREQIGYASVAQPDDPIAVIGRLVLWREDLTASQLHWEQKSIYSLATGAIKTRFRDARRHKQLRALVQRIFADPISDELSIRPTWLSATDRPEHLPTRPSAFFANGHIAA